MIVVVLQSRGRRAATANSPMPEPSYYTATDLRYRGARYTVLDYGAAGYTVVHTYDPRQRPMRRCGLRERLVAAARAFGARS